MKKILALFSLLFIIYACSSENSKIIEDQFLFFEGDIITMGGDKPNYVESIVTNSDTIVFVGSLLEANEQFPFAKKIDLNGGTLLPGFIDGHAHFAGFPSQSIGAQILPRLMLEQIILRL